MMKNKVQSLYMLVLSIMLTVISFAAFAQEIPTPEIREDFTEDELGSFVVVYMDVMAIQQVSENKMVQAIEDANLTVERFNELLAAQQTPEADVEATAEEMAAFNDAAQGIIAEREKIEDQVISAIEGEGLDVQTYQEIMVAYQYSQQIQEKLNRLLQEEHTRYDQGQEQE